MLDRNGRVARIVKLATDVTAQVLRNIDHDGQLDALHRSQAVIEFTLDGTILTANQNFLDAVGYSLDEVKGRHHGLFVEATERAGTGVSRILGAPRAWRVRLRRVPAHRQGRSRGVDPGDLQSDSGSKRPAGESGQVRNRHHGAEVADHRRDGAARRRQSVTSGDPIRPRRNGARCQRELLKAVGYRIEEIRGQHHAMFVEPGYAKTSEYAAFWDRLRAGEFATGMFQRFGKGNRNVWIQASYNPIFDRTAG